MVGWWISMGCLLVAVLAVTPRYNRHRARRVQVARVRARLAAWPSAPQSPVGGIPAPRNAPPTGPKQPVRALDLPDRGTGRRRPKVELGDPSLLSSTLVPGWRFR
ncbi:hypothetical protein SAMN04488000_118101 [Lentzea albida]|uniref:Uncharacterized protein n=1 Tax=Lentzea albida TaxID=65499 RepID=A0A1H9VGG1_9PSEU|nr:hypothetical protein SAMN04488000_118101 [Lentzea albida]